MKISFYELLGMIKDNKQPKKVVYNDIVYEWNEQGYFNPIRREYMSGGLYDTDMLEQNITILEITQLIEEDKDIEELSIKDNCLKDERGCYCSLNKHTRIIANKINELVREVNKLKNK